LTTDTVLIVGAGQTAAMATRTLRRRGFGGRVVLIGEEPHLPYQRPPLSKEYLQGVEERSGLFLLSEEWCVKNDLEVRLGTRVEGIDAVDRAIELSDQTRVRGDAVLIATGGRPRQIPGVQGERVHYLRTIEDSDRIKAMLGPDTRLVVIGGGFIGLEVAASARVLGAQVTVLEMLDVPLERVLGRQMGAVCAELHRGHGVQLLTGDTVETVTETAEGVVVRTGRGAVVEGDLVVVGVGIAPNVEVAEAAGLKVANGIVVDEYCRTSLDGVYAAGDVANHFHPLYERYLRVEHFDNANKQGAAAANNILGRATVFDDPHWFWSDQYEVNIQHAGHADAWTELVIRGSVEQRDFVAFYLDGATLRAAFGIDRGEDISAAKELIAARAAPEPDQLRDEDVDLFDLLPEA
jgi:3-phenylpropionate/trans-cinnamate dioxygenase ferredoxin reductase component